jgi:2-amino-4-hydroxy-6-hydroxymethyldihydropteridine diphosphokinase
VTEAKVTKVNVIQVFISIGSNIERETNVRSAVRALRAQFGELQLSSVYESEAVGFDGDPFYNLVAGFTVEDTPHDVLQGAQQVMTALRAIETAHGRERHNTKFSARTLDLDLLLFGDADLRSQGLDIPRDEITRYAFVLGPLAEIVPQLAHPLLDNTYARLWHDYQVSHPQQVQAMRPVAFRW